MIGDNARHLNDENYNARIIKVELNYSNYSQKKIILITVLIRKKYNAIHAYNFATIMQELCVLTYDFIFKSHFFLEFYSSSLLLF